MCVCVQASRTASSILDLEDEAMMEASVQAGYTRRSSASVTPVQPTRVSVTKADGAGPAKAYGIQENGREKPPLPKKGCCTIS